jgi:hypothetical protein
MTPKSVIRGPHEGAEAPTHLAPRTTVPVVEPGEEAGL